MLPVIIEAQDKIDALYTVDSKVRSSIANGLQAGYFLAVDIERSFKEALRFWQETLPALRSKLSAFADLHRDEFESVCQSAMFVVSVALLVWQAYNDRVDAFVSACEKTEEEVIDEQLQELGIAQVEVLRLFATGFVEVFTAEPQIEELTLRELWEVAKGKISGYRKMSKATLVAALAAHG